ncbi:MAG TPA: polysaccharide deacetylase family protein, partial [Chitinispirillaceae bacterium]|nr:polysaccharide deacetylase family protein [Chitinispirillaceae bacterium]
MAFSLSILLRSTLASLRMAAGVYRSRLKTLAAKRQSVILMYHRIIDPANTDEYIEPGMFVNPSTFDMHLDLLTRFFTVVSLQEVLSSFNNIADKPFCAITFDDGWRDFYDHAYPILKSRNLPATNFLATDYVGTSDWFWTDRLANILKKISVAPCSSGEIKSDDILSKIGQLTGSLFFRIDSAIKMLKPLSQKQIQKILEELERRHLSNEIANKRAFMNWDECRELKKSGLITFGSHTAQHIILTAEDEDVCRNDLQVSRNKLIEEKV